MDGWDPADWVNFATGCLAIGAAVIYGGLWTLDIGLPRLRRRLWR